VLEAGGLPGRTALEFGCGTGTNAIELARRGYKVTAIDLVEEPVAKAREKSRRAGVDVDFRVGDLTRAALGGPYDVLFDSGVYHGIRNRDLEGLLATAGRVTRPGSRWLSLAGNAREARPDGPPAVSEGEIRRELERDFRILELREFRFDLGPAFQPLAWSILMERK
jgi:SAM-dependent methyltransferase